MFSCRTKGCLLPLSLRLLPYRNKQHPRSAAAASSLPKMAAVPSLGQQVSPSSSDNQGSSPLPLQQHEIKQQKKRTSITTKCGRSNLRPIDIQLVEMGLLDQENEEICFQNSAVGDKHYEWQMLVGNQWLKIENDHVIETHYCQPGAKGITINTSQGQVFIDFDTLQTNNASLRVQRFSFLPQGQMEDFGWYFRDDCLWREYGSQSFSTSSSSISSRDIEHNFTLNAQGVLHFTVGSVGYSLNFPTMTQQNCTTGLSRKVRRRPKFTPSPAGLHSFKWEFMGDEGQWTEYQAQICSLDSSAIESQYQLNQQGQLHFRIKRFSYTLDFSRMCQVNNIGTKRQVRRTPNYGVQKNISAGSRWQFLDINGMWTDYSKDNAVCSVSSPDIEFQYQQNPSGTMTFTTSHFSYRLDFSAMTQRNLSTNTSRSVRRLIQ